MISPLLSPKTPLLWREKCYLYLLKYVKYNINHWRIQDLTLLGVDFVNDGLGKVVEIY